MTTTRTTTTIANERYISVKEARVRRIISPMVIHVAISSTVSLLCICIHIWLCQLKISVMSARVDCVAEADDKWRGWMGFWLLCCVVMWEILETNKSSILTFYAFMWESASPVQSSSGFIQTYDWYIWFSPLENFTVLRWLHCCATLKSKCPRNWLVADGKLNPYPPHRPIKLRS